MAIVADVPARPDGLELIGEMEASGYRTPPSLVRRHDGQTLQLTPLLYAILEAVDGRRGFAEIAERVAARTGRRVTPSDVGTLVEEQLRPMGLLLRPDGRPPELERSDPLLGLRFKVAVTDPATTRRLTDPFRILFHPLVWVPIVAVFGWLTWWLLMDRGLAAATYQAFAKPGLLLLVLGVTVLSAGFHEFGHAAAARRGGAQPGVMGAGLYLVWPAFYTDVTDSYRLGRWARVRTDLGGLYFNAIVATAITGLWWVTGWDALLLVVAAQVLQMLRQLLPLVRFDGYHVLADMTGVPDLYSRIGPILMSFLPTRRRDPRVADLRWWARLLVSVWVLVVVPVLLFSLFALVLAVPRVLGTALEGLGREQAQLAQHWDAGRYLDGLGAALAMAAISFPILAIGILLGRLVVSSVRALWRRTEGRPVRRAAASGLVLATVAAVSFAWWPSAERYRPVRPYEGGTLLDVAAVPLAAVGYPLASDRQAAGGEIVTVLPRGATSPREGAPQLALILVPVPDADAGGSGPGAGDGASAPAWVFPFDRPAPPGPDDNQALAVNTTDGRVAYDVAIAWVWVTGDEPVLDTNEAYAFASCADCVTVAVAFQVVVIIGEADVVVPQNLSAAVNYRCFECITAAVASQLVITVESEPGLEQQRALAEIWDEVAAFAETIPTLPLADVIAQLEAYKERIVVILGGVPVAGPGPSPGPSGTPAPSGSPSPDGSGSAAPAVSGEPTPLGPSPTPPSTSGDPVATPSAAATSRTDEPPPSPEPVPSTEPTPSTGPTASPTPAGSAGPSPEPTSSPTP